MSGRLFAVHTFCCCCLVDCGVLSRVGGVDCCCFIQHSMEGLNGVAERVCRVFCDFPVIFRRSIPSFQLQAVKCCRLMLLCKLVLLSRLMLLCG